MRTIGRLCLAGLALLALTVGAVLWTAERAAAARLPGSVDALIVLGGGVDGDGVPHYSTRRRAAAAAAAWKAGEARLLIMSGGTGRWHPDRSVAAMMRDIAVAAGVPPEAVLTEDRSLTTLQNLRLVRPIAEAAGAERLALLSDAYHIPRAEALARWLGYGDLPAIGIRGVEREGLTATWPILREALAWWLNLGKAIAWEGLALSGLSEAEIAERVI